MQLSPHFGLSELLTTSRTQFAAAQVGGAASGTHVRRALVALCTTILEPVRVHVGRAVKVTSGYRCPSLNAATTGASKTSQHTRGEAADIQVHGFTDGQLRDLFDWIAWESGLPFGQVIYEDKRPHDEGGAWIHVSLGAPWRAEARCGQVLTWTPASGYQAAQRPVR